MTELEFEKWYEGRKSMYDEFIDILKNIVDEDNHAILIDAIGNIDISKGYKVEE